MRFVAILLFVFAFPCGAQTYYGKVVGVTDGDTLTLLTPEKQQIKVRLAEIDTPERGQPWGTKAKQALSDLAFGKEARIEYRDTDRYGRIVGRVYVGDIDVNAELVREGHAWVYRQYVTDRSLFALEEQAKANGRGLWRLPEAETPPWDWRRGVRNTKVGKTQPRLATDETNAFTCGSKTYCREMRSCDEAMFYLTQCGLTRLDGDSDGVPCEKICQ